MRSPLAPADVDTYLGAVDWLMSILEHPSVAETWENPSALARYSTGGVASHAVYAGVVRLVQLLGEPDPPTGSLVTVAEYFGPNRVAAPTDDDPLFVILREGAEKTARRGLPRLLETCRAARNELATVLPGTPAGRAVPVARIAGATSTVSDYLRTRVLEVIVHGDDVVASVAWDAAPPPPRAAVDVCVALCIELARAHSGDVGTLRAFTRAERADPGALRVL